MIITTSNVLLGTTPTVTTGSSRDNPANITNQDFSANYTFSSTSAVMEFGSTSEIGYVAIAGVNLGRLSGVGIYDGNSRIYGTSAIYRSNCLVFAIERRSFSNLTIRMNARAVSGNARVAFVAAGDYISVPNGGEQAGYNRNWLTRSTRITSQVNSMGAPIAQLKSRAPLSGSLNIPNASKLYSVTAWQNFLDFAQDNVFFIRETDSLQIDVGEVDFDTPNDVCASYVCFDAQDSTSAHSQTRLLDSLSLKFKVFNGL